MNFIKYGSEGKTYYKKIKTRIKYFQETLILNVFYSSFIVKDVSVSSSIFSKRNPNSRR